MSKTICSDEHSSNCFIKRFNVNLQVEAQQLSNKYKEFIIKHIVTKYEKKCYMGCFIDTIYTPEKHIDLTKTMKTITENNCIIISPGIKKGSHLNGHVTYNVYFYAKCYIFKIGDEVLCKVTEKNDYCILGTYYPIDTIFVPKSLVKPENMDNYENVAIGDTIYVKILEYDINNGKMVSCCTIEKLYIDSDVEFNLPTNSTNININSSEGYKYKIIPELIQLHSDVILSERNIDKYDNIFDKKNQLWDYIKDLIYDYNKVHIMHQWISRAYYKLFEILIKYDIFKIDSNINIACIAEAPGAFSQAIYKIRSNYKNYKDNYYLISKYRDVKEAKEKSHYYRNIKFNIKKSDFPNANIYIYNDDIKMDKNKDQDYTGDLTDVREINKFTEMYNIKSSCMLVTADGGFESINEKETAHIELFFSEIITAFSILKEGGAFIIKIYSIFYTITAELILFLSSFFKEAYIYKPYTSKQANMEKYIVCKSFKGITENELNEYKNVLKSIITKYEILNINIQIQPQILTQLNQFSTKLSNISIKKINQGISYCIDLQNKLQGLRYDQYKPIIDEYTRPMLLNDHFQTMYTKWLSIFNIESYVKPRPIRGTTAAQELEGLPVHEQTEVLPVHEQTEGSHEQTEGLPHEQTEGDDDEYTEYTEYVGKPERVMHTYRKFHEYSYESELF